MGGGAALWTFVFCLLPFALDSPPDAPHHFGAAHCISLPRLPESPPDLRLVGGARTQAARHRDSALFDQAAADQDAAAGGRGVAVRGDVSAVDAVGGGAEGEPGAAGAR